MIRLLYTSLADLDLSLSDIQDILHIARDNNAKLGVTGMLFFNKKYFLQALEGEENTVIDLYNSIADDYRHAEVNILGKQAITEREFAEWDMGYASLSSDLHAIFQQLNILDDNISGLTEQQSLKLLLALRAKA